MSSCNQSGPHKPHPFTTTQGSYPPVERTERYPGVEGETPRPITEGDRK